MNPLQFGETLFILTTKEIMKQALKKIKALFILTTRRIMKQALEKIKEELLSLTEHATEVTKFVISLIDTLNRTDSDVVLGEQESAIMNHVENNSDEITLNEDALIHQQLGDAALEIKYLEMYDKKYSEYMQFPTLEGKVERFKYHCRRFGIGYTNDTTLEDLADMLAHYYTAHAVYGCNPPIQVNAHSIEAALTKQFSTRNKEYFPIKVFFSVESLGDEFLISWDDKDYPQKKDVESFLISEGIKHKIVTPTSETPKDKTPVIESATPVKKKRGRKKKEVAS